MSLCTVVILMVSQYAFPTASVLFFKFTVHQQISSMLFSDIEIVMIESVWYCGSGCDCGLKKVVL